MDKCSAVMLSGHKPQVADAVIEALAGFDHGAGHPLLFLDDANAPNCQKNNGFSDLGNYSEWPKVAGAVIQAPSSMSGWHSGRPTTVGPSVQDGGGTAASRK